jgi:hypothetical protein
MAGQPHIYRPTLETNCYTSNQPKSGAPDAPVQPAGRVRRVEDEVAVGKPWRPVLEVLRLTPASSGLACCSALWTASVANSALKLSRPENHAPDAEVQCPAVRRFSSWRSGAQSFAPGSSNTRWTLDQRPTLSRPASGAASEAPNCRRVFAFSSAFA